MRILFATYSLAFQNPGGGEQVLLNLESALEKRGHEVVFYNPWTGTAGGFDVIHYFSCHENSFWRFAKISAPTTPLIVTPTIYLPPGPMQNFRALRHRTTARLEGRLAPLDRSRFFSLPDLWLPATKYEAQCLSRVHGVPLRKTAIQPNGASDSFCAAKPELFRAFVRERFGFTGDFFLHVGRFDPVKNQPVLIRALRSAGLAGVFIGSASFEHEDYRKQCLEAAQGTSNLFFVDPFPNNDPLLASAYAACSAFVLPSLFETFGISALEAAMSGARLILSSKMAAHEVFDGYADWIDPVDSIKLADLLTRRVAAPRTTEAVREQKAAFAAYSWMKIAQDLEATYTSML